MQNCTLDHDGNLIITASTESSKHDFDFYEGKWKIRNRKLIERLIESDDWEEFDADQEMKIILLGLGNTDNFIANFAGKPFEGRTIRLFNPESKLWSMYWCDSSAGILQPPTVGSFEEGIGKFYCKDSFKGQEIIVEFLWDKRDEENPIWSQSFSNDGGKTWECNWWMFMKRVTSKA